MEQLVRLLSKYGTEVVAEMRTRLKNSGKVASGELFRSLEWRVVETDDEYQLEILAAEYAEYVDKGRRPGKQPPVSKIRKWCRLRGIPEKAAYPIARKIGRFGTPPTNFLTVPWTRRMAQLDRDIENVLSAEVQAKLDRFFRRDLGDK